MSASLDRNARSRSPSGTPTATDNGVPTNKHLLTPVERQRLQLEKLLKNPEKDVFVPGGPKEKTIRPPRETMKNVQGSSAGAGSGEFHVYKQSRRREYERLKMMEDKAKAEEEAAAFAARQQARLETADAKTSKNRARRQKRKAGKSGEKDTSPGPGSGMASAEGGDSSKKRKLGLGTNAASGKGMVFRRPGEESDDEQETQDAAKEEQVASGLDDEAELPAVPVAQEPGKIIIHDSD
ncbi:hypothetical protein QFC22_006212 [Naganishia vaughanmartiniae]|uniref:Uncharacterized protein n=1 Tax=Naganishia vaughanmartiniae TaxID=1424756 RepID=A0ACC2WNG3_9TREE|nr:hypothetical protein QFC22_006212 [Naganishia vaughanmartiniae]